MDPQYKSIFSPSTKNERLDNFESYWQYTLEHDGKILEFDKDLQKKRIRLMDFQKNLVRSRNPLPDPQVFYRNYIKIKDDPQKLDRKTLLLSCIYKFARHEWVGISAAWNVTPNLANSTTLTDKISRYHLCEEFSHVRLFHEMFRTFQLSQIKWVPLGRFMRWVYKIFPRLPDRIMAAPAFVTELMGITFYMHVDQILDTVFADEPEARDRIRELLHEIMVDEIAHIGQRRNYLGKFGIKLARWLVRPIFRTFYRDIPEAKHLFDIEQMIQDGLNFNYSIISPQLLQRSWVPTYCQIQK